MLPNNIVFDDIRVSNLTVIGALSSNSSIATNHISSQTSFSDYSIVNELEVNDFITCSGDLDVYGNTFLNSGSLNLYNGVSANFWSDSGTTLTATIDGSTGNIDAVSYTVGGIASTGTGGLVRATSPSLVTPNIGAATGTSLALSNGTNVLLTMGAGTWRDEGFGQISLNRRFYFNSSSLDLVNNYLAASNFFGLRDTTLSRNAPGIWQMGTTAANASGSLLLTNLTASGTVTTTALVTNNVITESTTSRVLALTDVGKYIRCTNGGAITIDIPQQTTVAWPDGTEIYFRRDSAAGAISLTGSGVTINGGSGSTSVPVNGNFALKKVATDVWDFI